MQLYRHTYIFVLPHHSIEFYCMPVGLIASVFVLEVARRKGGAGSSQDTTTIWSGNGQNISYGLKGFKGVTSPRAKHISPDARLIKPLLFPIDSSTYYKSKPRPHYTRMRFLCKGPTLNATCITVWRTIRYAK